MGGQASKLSWLLGWHSLDDLGRKEGRRTAIHGHIMHMGNSCLEMFSNPPAPLSLSLTKRRYVLIGLKNKNKNRDYLSNQMYKVVHIITSSV